MRALGIRGRILFTVLTPVVLVAVIVTLLLVLAQQRQATLEQHRRIAAVAQQLATLAEYPLFVGDVEALQKLLDAATREPDLLAAAFLDRTGRVVVSSLPSDQLPPPDQWWVGFESVAEKLPLEHWHALPIRPTRLSEADLFAMANENDAPLLGQLLVKVSTRALRDNTQRYALQAAAVAALALALASLFAIAFTRGLIRTLSEIHEVVEGIGLGRHDLRVVPRGDDELAKLAAGINAMAAAVAQTQEQLAERIIEATATLRHERDAAEHAARARSRFFAAASHDLRQPAQALGLFISRLRQENALPPPLKGEIEQLARAVSALQSLLGTLLDYSRLDGEVVRVELQPVAATQAIGRVIASLEETAAAKKIRLRSRIQPCWLQTDPALFHRILINLIGNAVKYTQHGGVLVTCRRRAGHARIDVWDTGPGIPPEAQKAIFDELVQLDNPERDADKGLGLGLAIVRKAAQLLNHPVTLRSRLAHGSCFTLTVPLSAPPPNAASRESSAGLPPGRLLLVGPWAQETEAIAALLSQWRFEVERACDAAEMAACLAAQTVEGVILDLPAADVPPLLAELERLRAATGRPLPVLVIANATAAPPHMPDRPSPPLVLSRPFRPARLRALLGRLLMPADSTGD